MNCRCSEPSFCGTTTLKCTCRSPDRRPLILGILSRLGPGRDLDFGILLPNRRHLDVGAQHGLVDRNGQLDVEIVAVPLEDVVWRHSDDDKEITGRTAEAPALPLPRQPEAHAVVDTGGHVDLQGHL